MKGSLAVLLLTYVIIDYVNGEIEYYLSMAEMDRLSRDDRQHYIYNDKINGSNNRFRAFDEIRGSKQKRAADPVFHGHPKSREELWHERFLPESKHLDQVPSLVQLVHNITLTYFNDCTPVLLYDSQIKLSEDNLFRRLFKSFSGTIVHGYVEDNNSLKAPNLLDPKGGCLHFILILSDVQRCHKVLGKQSKGKVVVVARSSQWAVQEYLASAPSRQLKNLLVISPSIKDDDETLEASYALYTHVLYTDGLGSSQAQVLTSWTHRRFTRNINLFPQKMTEGYAGHRFVIAVANRPPFTIKRSEMNTVSGDIQTVWDGVEIRLIKLLAEKNNFSIEYVEPRELHLGPGDAVAKEVASGRADIGIAGLYTTAERLGELDLSFGHSRDCAAFITLSSTALPRYRAILGPFHWQVWVALTFTYLIGIFPLAFSDKHTLSHLVNRSGEVENMFWYVFGTFTNCFTFVGKNSWSKTDKVTTRLLIGWYWIFTIIITSCYTGSIIAFVTLPIYPETIDTINQMLSGFFRVGTLDRGGWERWFLNSSDAAANKLLNKLEFVPDIETGIRNVTKAFFWPYAFLGSQAELKYLVESSFSKAESKRAVLHVSNECFVPFAISFSFPNDSAHTAQLSKDLRTMFQAGIIGKITEDVMWQVQKNSRGRLLTPKSFSTLSSNSLEEKGLTLEDTQGMFLLLGAGFLLATVALLSEWMGGFCRRCREWKRSLFATGSKEDAASPACDGGGGRLHFNTRSSSAESEESINGHFINVTQAGITIHNNYDVDDTRRSSSMDLDKEVERIFRIDEMRSSDAKSTEQERPNTVSKVFRDHIIIE